MDIFCLKCQEYTESENIKKERTKNGRNILKALCVECGKKKSKFVKNTEGGDLVDWLGENVGEMHFPGSNYLGPGTKFIERVQKGDKPTDRVDEAAMHHDLAYAVYKDKGKRHEADRKLLQELDAIENPTFKEKIKKVTTKAVIKPKLFLGLGNNQ